MKMKTITLITLSTILIGCSSIAPKMHTSGAGEIKIDKSKPNDKYEVIGAVTGEDGKGCGSFGYEGSHDRALIDLQNKINELHGEYGHITTVIEPHLDGGCFKNEYEIRAVAYRKIKNVPTPIYVEKSEEEVFTKKMRELKSLLNDGVLTQQEYEEQKSKLLEQGFNAK